LLTHNRIYRSGKLTDTLKRNLLRALSAHRGKIVFAYLFGSAAAGASGPLSDIDVAIYLRDEFVSAAMDLKLALHADLCRALRTNDVDLVILNTTKNLMLLEAIIRQGVVLVDQDPETRVDFELKTCHRVIDFRSQRAAILGV